MGGGSSGGRVLGGHRHPPPGKVVVCATVIAVYITIRSTAVGSFRRIYKGPTPNGADFSSVIGFGFKGWCGLFVKVVLLMECCRIKAAVVAVMISYAVR